MRAGTTRRSRRPDPPADHPAGLLRRLRPLVAVAAVLVAVLTVAGVLLTDVAGGSALVREDLEVVEDLVDVRSPPLDAVTSAATWLSNTLFVLAVLALAVVVTARWTRRWVAPAFLVVAVGGEKAVYLATSLLVSRDRPPVPTSGFVHATTSFPSGHVGAALALYGAIAVLAVRSGASAATRAVVVAVAVVVPPLVAFARLYRGLHYPSDVLAGAAMAGVWLAATWAVLLRGRPPAAVWGAGAPGAGRAG